MEEILSMEQEMLTPGSLGSDIEAELGASREAPARTVASPSPAPPARLREPPPPSTPTASPGRKKTIQ
jgi:hypothetical protein